MATKTRAELRDLVRTQLDVDDVELPDGTIDPWLEDGFERSLAIEDRWPFFEDSWTLTAVTDQIAYPKTGLTNASGYVLDQVTLIMDYTDSGAAFEVFHLPYDRARRIFGDTVGMADVPVYWSERGPNLYIWPPPATGRSITVEGYRKPSWAAGDATPPDCDERLHLSLFYFACAMAYEQQEDEVLSAEYVKHWQGALEQAHKRIMASPQRRPLIMSGETGSRWWPTARLA